MNEAHKISFSEYSFVKMFKSAGFEILDYGFTKSPKESIKFDYIHHYDTENIFIVCGKIEKKLSINLPRKEISKDIKSFKYELKSKYAELMFKNISLTLLVPSLRNLKRSVLYFAYGFIDLITLKLFKISLISKFLPKKK